VLNFILIASGYAASSKASEVGQVYTLFVGAAFIAASINSYFWNKYWTFKEGASSDSRQTIKFWIVTIFAFIVSVTISSYLFLQIPPPGTMTLGQWLNIGRIMGIACSLVVNFLGYKYIVFKK